MYQILWYLFARQLVQGQKRIHRSYYYNLQLKVLIFKSIKVDRTSDAAAAEAVVVVARAFVVVAVVRTCWDSRDILRWAVPTGRRLVAHWSSCQRNPCGPPGLHVAGVPVCGGGR